MTKMPKWKRCKVCGRPKRLASILGRVCYVHVNSMQSRLCERLAASGKGLNQAKGES